MYKKYINIFLILICLTLVMGLNVKAEENEDYFLLDEVVVIASKYPEKIMDAPVSTTVVTEEDIEEKNVQNAADLLRDIAGIHISDYGVLSGKKTISIRGSNSNQVLVMIDGQPINSSQNGEADLSQIPVEIIERIEISKDPASSLYGANALGGVVNIITKEAIEQEMIVFDTIFRVI